MPDNWKKWGPTDLIWATDVKRSDGWSFVTCQQVRQIKHSAIPDEISVIGASRSLDGLSPISFQQAWQIQYLAPSNGYGPLVAFRRGVRSGNLEDAKFGTSANCLPPSAKVRRLPIDRYRRLVKFSGPALWAPL